MGFLFLGHDSLSPSPVDQDYSLSYGHLGCQIYQDFQISGLLDTHTCYLSFTLKIIHDLLAMPGIDLDPRGQHLEKTHHIEVAVEAWLQSMVLIAEALALVANEWVIGCCFGLDQGPDLQLAASSPSCATKFVHVYCQSEKDLAGCSLDPQRYLHPLSILGA